VRWTLKVAGGLTRQGGLRRAVALRPRTPAGYLTKVIPVLGFIHGTGWEADDRQGDGAGMPARRAGPVVPDNRAAFRGLLKVYERRSRQEFDGLPRKLRSVPPQFQPLRRA
jgi:hypothetical protein